MPAMMSAMSGGPDTRVLSNIPYDLPISLQGCLRSLDLSRLGFRADITAMCAAAEAGAPDAFVPNCQLCSPLAVVEGTKC